MSKHTPGPWDYGGVAPVSLTFDKEVNIYPPHHSLTGGYQYGGPIAVVAVHGDAGGEANARLIAAAPDLLAASKSALMWVVGEQEANALRDAIAKAEGKGP